MKKQIKRICSFLIHKQPPIYKTVANICYLSPNNQLANKKIIITGGGRGLGLAMAKKFKAEGAEVLISGRNVETLKQSAEEIGCNYLQLDLQKTESFSEFINKADEILNGVNCLVNNAGISLHEEGFLAVNTNQFDAQFDTNLKGPFFLTQCFINKCEENSLESTKKIIFISSETGTTVDERPYGLTKAALNSLAQGIAYRYANKGYRINAIAPGVTISDMVGKKDRDNLYNGMYRYYLPEEIAEIASFLISDISNCLNGQVLVCNEGKTINARWK